MESKDRITFEISGNDMRNLRGFRKQHCRCSKGMAGDQFEYSFISTGLGMLITVKCSCGQTLSLGNFMDYTAGEYSKKDHPVLTKDDFRNEQFEDAIRRIMLMNNPRMFRIGFQTDRSFEMIYNVATYGIAQFADERIKQCILWKSGIGEHGERVDNYEGLDEAEKIDSFFEYFKAHAKKELEKYGGGDEKLRKLLE